MFGVSLSKLLPVVGTAFGIQAVVGSISVPLQSDKYYDLSGTMTYLACISVSLLNGRLGSSNLISSLHIRQIIVGAAASLWATRLGAFLFYRISRDGHDKRFDVIKKNPVRFSVAWTIQALWITLTALPVYCLLVTPAARLAPLGLLDYLGVSLWSTGFLFESVADFQKLLWQARIGTEARKTSFIDEGLWSLSRHPNYFGEIALWIGNFIICSSGYRHLGWTGLRTAGLFSISPLFVSLLLLKVSGIPLLERSSDKRFGQSKEYRSYKQNVPVLIPRLFSKAKTE